METFHKFLSKICVSPTIHVSWPNLAKIGRCEVAEKSSRIAHKKTPASGTLLSPPFRPHLTDRAHNFVNVSALDLCMCTDFGPDRLWFAGLIPERVQKSEYNIGFQL